MGAAGDLGPHQRVLCVENSCVNLLQGIPSQIVIAIARGAQKTGLADLIFLHGLKHLQLIIFCSAVYLCKTVQKSFEYGISIGKHLFSDAHGPVQLIRIAHGFSSFS